MTEQVTESPAPGLPAPENLGDIEPTKPADYGAINAVYLLLLGGLVAAARERDVERRISNAELLPLGAATFALSKVIAHEKIASWLRRPFVEEPRAAGRRPRGRGLRHAVGELVTCTRCVGAWSALGIVSVRLASPSTGRIVTSVLASSAINDFMQAGFRALCETANLEAERARGG